MYLIWEILPIYMCSEHLGFPGGTVVKHLSSKARDTRDAVSIPGLGRSPREENGNPL